MSYPELLYPWMPEQRAKPYGSYKPQKYPKHETVNCKRCNCDITQLCIRTGRSIYCKSCKVVQRRDTDRKRRAIGKLLPRNCKQCDSSFLPKKKRSAEFCSNGCWVKFHRKTKSSPKICQECNSPITLPNKRKYCSFKCMKIASYRAIIIRYQNEEKSVKQCFK